MECSEAAPSCPRRFRSGFGGAYRRFCFPRFSDALLMWSRISTSLKRGALHRKRHAVRAHRCCASVSRPYAVWWKRLWRFATCFDSSVHALTARFCRALRGLTRNWLSGWAQAYLAQRRTHRAEYYGTEQNILALAFERFMLRSVSTSCEPDRYITSVRGRMKIGECRLSFCVHRIGRKSAEKMVDV